MLRRYQGKEITSTLQANSREELNVLVGGMRKYAQGQGLGPIDILQSRRDPDGGYEAIVRAHNFNPFKWIKEKVGKSKEELEREKLWYSEEEESMALMPVESSVGEPRRDWGYPRKKESVIEEPREVPEVRVFKREILERKPIELDKDKEEGQKRRIKEAEEEEKRKGDIRKEQRKAEERAEALGRERETVDLAIEKQRLRKLGETKWQRFERTSGQVGKIAGLGYKAATLGGSPKVINKELYSSKRMRPLTATESFGGMRQLTQVGGGDSVLQRATTPELSGLQRLTTMGSSPLAKQVGSSSRLLVMPNLEKLRQVEVPKGLSPAEQKAYVEIKTNGDIDTRSNVIEELVKLGIPKEEASRAISVLLSKGLVKKDGRFGVLR